MKILLAALQCEAQPLIKHFGLKKESVPGRQSLYRGRDCQLILSGTGKVASAIAATRILSRLEDHAKTVIVNFGICGCADPNIPVGESFLINKIIDAASGRTFFPDILVRHAFRESAISTHDRPVAGEGSDSFETKLFDMEASGFFLAASHFLPPERIFCLKTVSDHLEGRGLDKKGVGSLLEKAIPAIVSILEAVEELEVEPRALSPGEEALLGSLSKTLRLTVSQSHHLKDWARAYRVGKRTGLQPLRPFLDATCGTKEERQKMLLRIKDALSL